MLKQKNFIPKGINQFCRGGGWPGTTMEYQVLERTELFLCKKNYAKSWNALELFFYREKNEIIEQSIE
jgi:hypothetical protein